MAVIAAIAGTVGGVIASAASSSTGLIAAGALVGAAGQGLSAAGAAAQNRQTQKALEEDIRFEGERSDIAVERQGEIAAAKSAALIASAAGAGVNVASGTPVDLLSDIGRQRGKNVREIARESGQVIARLRAQQAASDARAVGGIVKGSLGVAGSLLGGATKIAKHKAGLSRLGNNVVERQTELIDSPGASLPGMRTFGLA